MNPPTDKPPKAYSCVRCFERKVKCDKNHPCSGCIRSKVECVFRIPAAPRRKKKRPEGDTVLNRLKQYEQLLESKGINPAEALASSKDTNASSTSLSDPITLSHDEETHDMVRDAFHSGHPRQKGRLVIDQGKTRYIENNLWTSVTEELEQANDFMTDTEEEEDEEEESPADNTDLLLGLTPTNSAIQHLHPPPEQIQKLWQLFLDNINPLQKLIHAPTFQNVVDTACNNPESLSKAHEALMFTIYGTTVMSLHESDCLSTFGESRKKLLLRYNRTSKAALARARLLGTADVVVLQAFVLFLVMNRNEFDSRTNWTLAGVACRIAQGLGVHQDGSDLGLPPFETEMRRRLWWSIMILEFRSAELTGSGRLMDYSVSSTKAPSNVNDEDIWPGMENPPENHTRPTEMIICLLRYTFGAFWKQKYLERKRKLNSDSIQTLDMILSPWDSALDERDKAIDELEQLLEDKFLRYVDSSKPTQLLASIIGRSALSSMRLNAHHPRRYESEDAVPEKERQLLWNLSIGLMENDSLACSTKSLRGLLWHTHMFFQWQALIYILGVLKKQTIGPEVERAWSLIGQIFVNHPQFVEDYRKPLHYAVGNLVLKAYAAREEAIGRLSSTEFYQPPFTPEYITTLRQQREKSKQKSPRKNTTDSSSDFTNQNQSGSNTVLSNFSDPSSGDFTMLQSPSVIQPNHPSSQQRPPQVVPYTWDPFNLPQQSGFGQPLPSDYMLEDMPMDWTQWDYLISDSDMQKPIS